MSVRNLIVKTIALAGVFQLSACGDILPTAGRNSNYLTPTAEITENSDRFLGQSVITRTYALTKSNFCKF